MSSQGRALRWGGLLVVMLACGVWVVSDLDTGRAASALMSLDPRALLGVLAAQVCLLLLRTWRFQLLLPVAVSYRRMLSAVSIGFLAVNVVPFRMGELVRPWLLADRDGVPIGNALAALVVERLLDLIFALLLISATLSLVTLPSSGLVVQGVDLFETGVRSMGVAVAVIATGAVGVGLIGDRAVEAVARVLDAIPGPLAGLVRRFGGRFAEGFQELAREPLRGLAATAVSAGMWLTHLACVAVCLWGFPELPLDLPTVVVNWGATAVGIALLPVPGFFGPFEAGSAGSLEWLGADASVARTFALVLHSTMFLHHAAMGGLFLLLDGVSLRAAVRGSQGSAAAEEP